MDRRFLLLWAGQTVSGFGTQISLLAIPTIAILGLHASPAQTGLLGTLEFVWFPILGLTAGVVADRYRRRPILIAADVARGCALLSIPSAFLFHTLTLSTLFVVATIVGICSVFFEITYQSYLPDLVERDALVHANSRLQMSASAAELGGMPLAGTLIGLFGAAVAVIADALSFFASALSLALIGGKDFSPDAAHERPLDMLRSGIRIVFHTPIIRNVTICTAISNFASGINIALWLQYAYRLIHVSPLQVGLIGGIGAIGILLSSGVASRLAASLGFGKTVLLAAVGWTVGASLLPVAVVGSGLAILAASNFLADFGSALYNIVQVSLRQRLVPVELQGRMNATIRTVAWGMLPLGSIIGGAVAQRIGIYPVMFVGIGCGLASIWVVLFSPILRYSEQPAQ
ncbi:MAG TPA: MFS transporter [Candidatus Eremiobacteraceae bacterium]|nr:MFS transporter [Candidatus Eremiobacteraceae bacterium]